MGLYPGLKPEFQSLNLAGKGLGRLNSVTETFASGRNWPNLSQLSPLSGVRQLKTYHAKKAGPEGHRFDPEFSRLSPLSWLSSDSLRHDGIHGVNWPSGLSRLNTGGRGLLGRVSVPPPPLSRSPRIFRVQMINDDIRTDLLL